jgi:hypothetical protein
MKILSNREWMRINANQSAVTRSFLSRRNRPLNRLSVYSRQLAFIRGFGLHSCGLAFLFLLPVIGVAQTSLSVGNVPGYPGTTVTVPVSLRPTSGGAVAAQFDVAFNTAKGAPGEARLGERFTNHVVRSRQVSPGVERVLIYSLNNAALGGTNETVANLPFTVAPTEFVGSGPLTPGNVVLARADATRVTPVSANAGSIFVRPVNLLPDGSAQFFLPSIADQRYAIQATTNFVQWVNISTNVATGDFMNLLDVDAMNRPYRFYRWELLSP